MSKPVTLPWAQGIWQQTQRGVAAWTAHALPPPAVDANDRAPVDTNALLSLAVALDVLSTRTRALQDTGDAASRAQVLARLTQIAWEVGALSGTQLTSPTELLRLADSGEACERARVSRALCDVLAQHATEAGVPATPALNLTPASAPEMVTASLRRLEAVAQQIVHEACLNLAKRSILDYRAI